MTEQKQATPNEIIISLQTNLEMEQAKNTGSEQFINELTKANVFLRAQCTIVSKKIQEVMKQNMTNKKTSDAKIAELEAKIAELSSPTLTATCADAAGTFESNVAAGEGVN